VERVSASTAIIDTERRSVLVDGKERTVLIARPSAPMRLDVARLERMQTGDFGSKLDQAIIAAVDEAPGTVDLVLFDARGADGEPVWGFDRDLDDVQRMEFGHQLLRSQILMYRELLRRGCSGLLGVGFGSFELAAFQRGTVRVVTDLAGERDEVTGARGAELELDLWLIEHAAAWTGLTVDEHLASKTAQEIATRDAKRAEYDALVAAIR
jgi:hypothetical protein